jgi:predicted DNA-binding protein (UPF0251 family)
MIKYGRNLLPFGSGEKLVLSQGAFVRFWSSVDTQTPSEKGCWFWKGYVRPDGYGEISVKGKVRRAHRVSFEMHNGGIGEGECVCHACDVPGCVRPDHLWLGTRDDNQKDMAKKGRAARGDRNGAVLHPERMERGEAHHNAKLTEKEVREIRKLYLETGLSQSALAKKYGVAQSAVFRILNRKSWKHLV